MHNSRTFINYFPPFFTFYSFFRCFNDWIFKYILSLQLSHFVCVSYKIIVTVYNCAHLLLIISTTSDKCFKESILWLKRCLVSLAWFVKWKFMIVIQPFRDSLRIKKRAMALYRKSLSIHWCCYFMNVNMTDHSWPNNHVCIPVGRLHQQ